MWIISLWLCTCYVTLLNSICGYTFHGEVVETTQISSIVTVNALSKEEDDWNFFHGITQWKWVSASIGNFRETVHRGWFIHSECAFIKSREWLYIVHGDTLEIQMKTIFTPSTVDESSTMNIQSVKSKFPFTIERMNVGKRGSSWMWASNCGSK